MRLGTQLSRGLDFLNEEGVVHPSDIAGAAMQADLADMFKPDRDFEYGPVDLPEDFVPAELPIEKDYPNWWDRFMEGYHISNSNLDPDDIGFARAFGLLTGEMEDSYGFGNWSRSYGYNNKAMFKALGETLLGVGVVPIYGKREASEVVKLFTSFIPEDPEFPDLDADGEVLTPEQLAELGYRDIKTPMTEARAQFITETRIEDARREELIDSYFNSSETWKGWFARAGLGFFANIGANPGLAVAYGVAAAGGIAFMGALGFGIVGSTLIGGGVSDLLVSLGEAGVAKGSAERMDEEFDVVTHVATNVIFGAGMGILTLPISIRAHRKALHRYFEQISEAAKEKLKKMEYSSIPGEFVEILPRGKYSFLDDAKWTKELKIPDGDIEAGVLEKILDSKHRYPYDIHNATAAADEAVEMVTIMQALRGDPVNPFVLEKPMKAVKIEDGRLHAGRSYKLVELDAEGLPAKEIWIHGNLEYPILKSGQKSKFLYRKFGVTQVGEAPSQGPDFHKGELLNALRMQYLVSQRPVALIDVSTGEIAARINPAENAEAMRFMKEAIIGGTKEEVLSRYGMKIKDNEIVHTFQENYAEHLKLTQMKEEVKPVVAESAKKLRKLKEAQKKVQVAKEQKARGLKKAKAAHKEAGSPDKQKIKTEAEKMEENIKVLQESEERLKLNESEQEILKLQDQIDNMDSYIKMYIDCMRGK